MEGKRILIQCFQAGTHLCSHHQAAQLKAGAAVFLLAASRTTRMLRDKAHFRPVCSVLVLYPSQTSFPLYGAVSWLGLSRSHPCLGQTGAAKPHWLNELHVQPLRLQGEKTSMCQVERQSKHGQEEANSQHSWTTSRAGFRPAGNANQSIRKTRLSPGTMYH